MFNVKSHRNFYKSYNRVATKMKNILTGVGLLI